MDKANREGWAQDRSNAYNKSVTRVEQTIADAAADNATLAADVKKRLLLRLKRTEANMPMDATEAKVVKDGKTAIYKLRDLTAAYRDLTSDMVTVEAGNDLLSALMELERRG